MESPVVSAFPESPMDYEEAAYPCKGCGEILEEGKAFELSGNRWHIDCFRCNTCNTLLDSDANLLLLGDGSLICNNCTYSCSSCGNKIEDLAILTGDQAFCANCFKCRNCKRKIENLRYARTSQGIFCMDCHEALMARRRKKTGRGGASRSKNSSHLDKSLPAIPPPEARKTAYIPGADPSMYAEPLPPEMGSVSNTVSALREEAELESSPPMPSNQSHNQGLTLPSTTYRNNRQSFQSAQSDMSNAGNEEYLIPLTFDPNPPKESPAVSNQATPRVQEEKPREYFNRSASQGSVPNVNSRGDSPHIAYQDKSRQPSGERVERVRNRDGSTSQSGSATTSPFITLPERNRQRLEDPKIVSQSARSDSSHADQFKLQEAPKSRTISSSTSDARSGGSTPRMDANNATSAPAVAELDGTPQLEYSSPFDSHEASPMVNGNEDSPTDSYRDASAVSQEIPRRGDSLDNNKRTIPRKELNASAQVPTAFAELNKEPQPSKPVETHGHEKVNGGKTISAPITSPDSQSILATPNINDIGKKGESFVEPRAPPPPPEFAHSRNASITESQKSPKLPRYSGGGDFTLEEDMARILGDEPAGHESFLRRVSNSVRHGRSYSEKSGRMSRERWPKSPTTTSLLGQEISSPTGTSPEHRDELSWFKNELRKERQRNVEKDRKIAELEAQLDSTANIKQVNSELKEKRSTMVVLDTQKEIVVRELEVLTEHLSQAKADKQPFDVGKMSNAVLRDFAESLEKLKNSFSPQIEEFIEKRNALLEELAKLTQMKDKSFQEFEQLSLKNAQLAELNNQLVHQIQDIYKSNTSLSLPEASRAAAVVPPNGLGIYSHHKDKSQVSIESREMTKTHASEASIADSGTTLTGEVEPIQVIGGPNVVSIKKGQPKKFDWRKGQKVAKGMAKGVKGAFSSTQQSYNRDLQFAETGAYGQPQQPEYSNANRNMMEPPKQGFGFFGGGGGSVGGSGNAAGGLQKPPMRGNGLYAAPQASTSARSLTLDPSTHLYGSELELRADYEKTLVPYIVQRCIEEVESRGMDVEGIYRKSGGNSQVQHVKDGFERSPPEFDVSDPDLDIHAVTSGLKQYFRRLPTPLITFSVYDKLLEATLVPEGPNQKAQRIETIQQALGELPKVHYDVLEFLIGHLARVVMQEQENLMTSLNIAVVFAPTIMRPENLNRELTDTKAKNEVVTWLVEESDKIFIH